MRPMEWNEENKARLYASLETGMEYNIRLKDEYMIVEDIKPVHMGKPPHMGNQP